MDFDQSSFISMTRFKIVFVGDISVGKTSVINRFVENKFKDVYDVYYYFYLKNSLQSELILPQSQLNLEENQLSFKYGTQQAKKNIKV